jgi:hypothetical protein
MVKENLGFEFAALSLRGVGPKSCPDYPRQRYVNYRFADSG